MPLDYYSVGYCISHSQCQWVLGLLKEGIDETGAKMLAAGAATRTGSGRVVGLKVNHGLRTYQWSCRSFEEEEDDDEEEDKDEEDEIAVCRFP